jgi:hypothetical protein
MKLGEHARSASATDVSLDNSSWNLNLWGEDLIATVRNGAIYYWDTSTGIGNRAVLASSLAGASSIPTVSRITTVSFPDRHFITAGCQAYAVGGGGNVDDMLVRVVYSRRFHEICTNRDQHGRRSTPRSWN